MMERLYSVKDLQERYQCSATTARDYIHQMPHIEKPLMVTESALMRWEHSKTVPGSEDIQAAQKIMRKAASALPEEFRIPRRKV